MVEHHLAKVGVAGSNPVFRSIWGLSSAGRAPALHAGGQGFDPPRLHHHTTYFALNHVHGLRLFLLSYGNVAAFIKDKIRTNSIRSVLNSPY